jgi:hypothetical protein
MGDTGMLILGAIVVIFWREIGYFGSWVQERTWRFPKGELTTGRNLRSTQILFLLGGIAMLVTALMSMASRG